MVTFSGADLYEGFSFMQALFKDQGVSVGVDWLVSYMLIRESAHTPYRYLLNQAKVRPRTNDDDPYVKELLVTGLAIFCFVICWVCYIVTFCYTL